MSVDTHVPAAESGTPELQWRKVHFITPLLDAWRAIAALAAFFVYQNVGFLETLQDVAGEQVLASHVFFVYVLGALVIGVVLIGGYTFLAWKRTSFAVGEDAVWFRSGLLLRQQRHARYERIQSLDIIHPLLGRIFGLGQLQIEVAGGANSNVKIGYLTSDELDALRRQVAALAAGRLSVPLMGDSDEPGEKRQGNEAPATVRMEETPLYAVPFGLQLRALLRSAHFWVPVFILLQVIVVLVVGRFISGEWYVASFAAGFAPLLLGVGGYLWSQLHANFGFQAFAVEEGIRIQRGLLETRSQTIPPRRVHAVEISQSLLWRQPDWYAVRLLQAGYAGENQKVVSDFLLPVGTRTEVELALWLVAPDLGVDKPLDLIAAALHGKNTVPDPYFHGVLPRVRWIDWFSWKRRAFALTRTAVITRDGWLRRRTIVIPFERLQALSVEQGPIQRRLGVATIHIETVPGNMDTRIHHLDARMVSALTSELVHLASYRRRQEDPVSWVERVSATTGERHTTTGESDAQ